MHFHGARIYLIGSVERGQRRTCALYGTKLYVKKFLVFLACSRHFSPTGDTGYSLQYCSIHDQTLGRNRIKRASTSEPQRLTFTLMNIPITCKLSFSIISPSPHTTQKHTPFLTPLPTIVYRPTRSTRFHLDLSLRILHAWTIRIHTLPRTAHSLFVSLFPCNPLIDAQ